jgi:nucleoside-diphosphate-sugar epimerase
MRILLLGGTGVIGNEVAKSLKHDHEVFVTSRSKAGMLDGVSYVKLNARELDNLLPFLQKTWDVVIDFLVYSTKEFKKNLPALLKYTKHYIFISSCRVFTPSNTAITESSLRLIDSSDDSRFLNSDEYAITKARQENLLCANMATNWTIVRPYITFGTNRLQLGLYEKEEWLHRALRGHSLVISQTLLDRTTTITPTIVVAEALVKIAQLPEPLRQSINVVSDNAYRWSEVVEVVKEAFEESGLPPLKLCIVSDGKFEEFQKRHYQAVYDRLHNRIFDNKRFTSLLGSSTSSYCSLNVYKEQIKEFICSGQFGYIDLIQEAKKDKASREVASIRAFSKKIKFIKYLYHRI